MVLPPELLSYAENLYRRFPEEFMALGAPGLEHIYDLRSDGRRSRRILETPTEKTIEITMPRWQSPAMPPCHPSYHPGYSPYPPPSPWAERSMGYGPGSYPMIPPMNGASPVPPAWHHGHPGFNGALPQHPPHPAPPQGFGMMSQPQHMAADPADSASKAQMAQQLERLEAAVLTMMPSVQAMAATRAHHQAPPQFTQPPMVEPTPIQSIPARDIRPVATLQVPPSRQQQEELYSPASPLRNRRGKGAIQISPPHKVEQTDAVQVVPCEVFNKPPAAAVEKPPAVGVEKRESPKSDAIKPAVAAVKAAAQDKNKNKERLQITSVRMARDENDPESPRSPGRYTAWR